MHIHTIGPFMMLLKDSCHNLGTNYQDGPHHPSERTCQSEKWLVQPEGNVDLECSTPLPAANQGILLNDEP